MQVALQAPPAREHFTCSSPSEAFLFDCDGRRCRWDNDITTRKMAGRHRQPASSPPICATSLALLSWVRAGRRRAFITIARTDATRRHHDADLSPHAAMPSLAGGRSESPRYRTTMPEAEPIVLAPSHFTRWSHQVSFMPTDAHFYD